MPSAEKMETIDLKFREYLSYEQFKDFQDNLPRKFCTEDKAKDMREANMRLDQKFQLYISKEDLRKSMIQIDANVDKKLATRVSIQELNDGL